MNSISLLEMLEDEFLDGKGYLKRKIDVNRCVRLIDEIKNSLPECIIEAQKVIDNKQKILQNADIAAQKTIATAEQKVKHLISGSEIEQLAQNEAQKIINRATVQKEVLIDKTKAHLEGMFDEIERFLLGLLNMIRTNKQELMAVNFK